MIPKLSPLDRASSAVRLRLCALLLFCAMVIPSAWSQIIFPPGGGQQPVNYTATNLIRFSQTNYFTSEDTLLAVVTLVREGSLTNADFVGVEYSMVDGTAVSGTHYFRSSGQVFFFPGQAQVQISIAVIDNFSAAGNVSFTMVIRNPISGTETFAMIGDPSVATVTIIDDESSVAAPDSGFVEIAPGNGGGGFDFNVGLGDIVATKEEWNVNVNNNANFTPYGKPGVDFTVVRRGGARGKIEVDWRTTTNVTPVSGIIFGGGGFFGGSFGGVARPFEDFIPTNGTVTLNDYQMSANVLIRIPATIQSEPGRGAGIGGPDATNQFGRPPSTFGVELTAVRPAAEEAQAGTGVNPQLGTATQRRIALADISSGFSFSRRNYIVREGQRYVRIRVRRSMNTGAEPPDFGAVHVHYYVNGRGRPVVVDTEGNLQGNLFPLRPGSDYTTPYIDFEPPGSAMWTATMERERAAGNALTQDDSAARIDWGDGDVTDRFIVIPLFDDDEAEFNEDIQVVLYKHDAETDGFVNPWAGVCTITIIDNDQPAGASEVDFNPDVNPLTDPPYMTTPGANGTVQAVAVQPDGKVVLGGSFTAVNTQPRFGIARLNLDGSTDRTFNPGNGISGFVRAIALQPDGRILVGGGFDAVNGVERFNIARLMTNGAVDASFNPRLGPDGPVRSIALQQDGKILIGGEFNRVNGTNYNYFARLNQDGSLDTTFQIGDGPDGPVNSIAVSAGAIDLDREASGGAAEDRFRFDTGSSRGTLRIDYDFLQVPDSLTVYYGNTRIVDTGMISSNGTLTVNYPPAGMPADSTELEIVMNEGIGIEGTIWLYKAVVIPEVDPRPVIGGDFISYNRIPINFIARVNLDGSLDRSFDPGTGADDTVWSVAKQGNKVIMAGDFQTVDLRPRRGVARLNENGTLDTGFDPGSGFDNTVYNVIVQPNGRPLLGGVFRSFNETRRIGLARLNMDGSLDTTFLDTARNQFAGVPNPLSPEHPLSQENFILSMGNYRLTNLTVISNEVVDTTGTTNLVFTTNVFVRDHLFVGGRFTNIGGGFFRDEARSRLNIARLNGGWTPGPGNITLLRDTYSVDENAGRTFITLSRTNGSLAPISARFDALAFPNFGPGVAADGVDFLSTNKFPLWIRSHDRDRQYADAFMGPNYDPFSTNRQRFDFNTYSFPVKPPIWKRDFEDNDIFVDIIDDTAIEGNEVVRLRLSQPDEGRLLLGGEPIPVGTALGRTEATLIISDNDQNYGTLGFSALEYFVNESEVSATITLTREGGTAGTVSVDVYTVDDTATSADYIRIEPRTPTTVTFRPGQTNATFSVRIRPDTIAELEESLFLVLTNAIGFPADVPLAQRLDPARARATLTIIDDDFAPGRVSFTAATYTASEADGSVVVTVRRSGGNTGDLEVRYRTSDGTATAGEDYVAVSGVLKWTHGESADKTFTIPLLNDDVVEADETINVHLSDATNPEAIGARPSAVVTIVNDDAVGTFSFSQSVYAVDENGPYADITVIRQNGISGSATVRFAATNLTAVGTTNVAIVTSTNGPPDYVFPEYVAANGFTNLLSFVEGQTSASFRIPLVDDNIVEGEKQIALTIFDATDGARLGRTNATLIIIDDELNNIPAGSVDVTFRAKGANDYVYKLELQADGRIMMGGDFTTVNDIVRNRLARLNSDGSLDPSYESGAGPSSSVRALELRSDNRLYVAGMFNSIAGSPRNRLARLNVDGKLDPTFDPGAGTDNSIFAAVEQPDGKLLIGGNFSTYRGVERRGIARVNTNGVVDVTFNNGTGPNGTVWAVALQLDGKVLIGGDFTSVNGTPRNRLARLNRDGSVDQTFGTSNGGANNSVRSIVVQSNGDILVGGFFTTYNGRPFNRVVRLRSTGAQAGTIDDSFTLGFESDSARATNGANDAVNVIALQIDGKILIGGDFTQFNNRTRSRITRLNSDGSLDPTINFGSGANGSVSDIIVQPDRRILIAGGFTRYDGQVAQNIARIHGGSISGSGRLTFDSPFFSATELEANALVAIRRVGGTRGTLTVDFVTTTTDTAQPGVDFIPVTNTVVFPEAETFRTVLVPLRRNTNALENRFITAILTNLVGPGSIGNQPNTRITIVNVDSQVQFSQAEYSVPEDFGPGAAFITVQRLGSTVGTLSVDVRTQDITATAGSDYGAVNATLVFEPGQASRTFSIQIFDDTVVEGNETLRLILTNLVGEGTITRGQATLTIIENDFSPGQVEFAASTFLGTEGSRQLIVRLRRVGGTTGAISVDYFTRPGGENPASAPSDYRESTGIVTFSDGVDQQSFVIELFDDTLVEGNETFLVVLTNPRGGTSIRGPSEALAIIVDDDLPSGSLDLSFNPGTGANSEIRTIELLADGDLLIGGAFTIYNGDNRLRLARLNSDASLDTSFDPGVGPDGTVADIALDSQGRLVLAGNFNTVQGRAFQRVARMSGDGIADQSFSLPLGFNAEVSEAVLQSDGKIVIVGMFDIASAAARNRIARLNTDGTVDITFNPGSGADAPVHAVALQGDGRILVGGAFATINGSSRRGVARLNSNGSVDGSFNAGGAGAVGGPVHDLLLLDNGQMLIVGDFTSYNGVPRNRAALLNSDGSLDQSFNPGGGPNRVVYTVARQRDGKFLIGGDFTGVSGVTRNRIARLNADGSHDLEFRPGSGANAAVLEIKVQPEDGRVLVAGRFTEFDNVARNRIARLNNDRGFITVQPVSFTSASRVNGHVRFTISSQPGLTYTLQAASEFGPYWTAMANQVATGSTTTFQVAPSERHQFFRVVVE